MKVLYVLSQDSGGLPHYAAELANAMSRHAEVVVFKPFETTADDLFDDAVECVEAFENIDIAATDLYAGDWSPVAAFRAALSYRNLARIEAFDPDIVHFTSPASMFPQVQLFTAHYGIDDDYPVIETYHDVLPNKLLRRGKELAASEPLSNVILDNVMKLGHRALPALDRAHTVVHTETNRDTLVSNGFDQSKISVVPHGMYEIFSQYDHADVSVEPRTILCFGQILPTKAHDVVAKAIPLVADRVGDVTCVIAGSGDLPADAKRVIDAHPDLFEVENRFVPNDEVGAYFRRARVSVLPHQRQNGHSGVMTISYAYGTPVVAADIADFPRLVEESGCGLVVPMDDPEPLADALATVLTDDDRWAAMRRNTQRLREQFSWENVAREHVAIYRDVLDEQPERPLAAQQRS